MYELPVGLPSELVPLSWLIGVWEGSGILDYTVDGETVTREFGQRISFSHDGLPHLNYSSYTWLEPETPATDASEPDSDGAPAPAATPIPRRRTPSATGRAATTRRSGRMRRAPATSTS